MHAFDYHRPSSVAEAAQILSQKPEASLLAGGQTLIPTLKQRLAAPSEVVDLRGIGDLRKIEKSGSNIVIGAMATHAQVANNPDVQREIPALAQLAGGIGDPQVRHAGTIAGSIANNDPAADYPAAILGLDATIVTDKRKIGADEFFDGLFATTLQPGEIITEVRFPIPSKAGYAKFERGRGRRVPLVRARTGAQEQLVGRLGARPQTAGQRAAQRPPRQRGVSRRDDPGDGRTRGRNRRIRRRATLG